MVPSATLTLGLTLALAPTPPRAAMDEPTIAYEIVTNAAFPLLPAPLGDYLEIALAPYKTIESTEDPVDTKTRVLRPQSGAHYLMLDVAAPAGDTPARHHAATNFPRHRAAAKAWCKEHGASTGGSLPWVLREQYRDLTQAMRTGDVEAIAGNTQSVLQSATDAALPFNTTVDREGRVAGNLHWAPVSSTRNLANHTARHRFHMGLPSHVRDRLEYEVRVWPRRCRPIDDPLDQVFDVMLNAHRCVASWLAMDAEVIALLEMTDAAQFAASSDRYYDALAVRAAQSLETQLEEAALLGANLVTGAWVAAGKPDPQTWKKKEANEEAVPIADKANPPVVQEAAFAGSSQSTVFHRAECAHVRRIRRSNLIRFETAKVAQDSGRTPCRSCKPDSP